jgi:hypothetical protein
MTEEIGTVSGTGGNSSWMREYGTRHTRLEFQDREVDVYIWLLYILACKYLCVEDT